MNLRKVGDLVEPIDVTTAILQVNGDSSNTSHVNWMNSIGIPGARDRAEQYTGRAIADSSYELRLSAFGNPIVLPVAPVRSITSVKYLDPDGAQQTLVDTVYTLDDNPDEPMLLLAYGQSWPAIRSQFDAVVITFAGGYNADDDCPLPAAIRAAMLLTIGTLFSVREDVVIATSPPGELPLAARDLLYPYRLRMALA